jgi:hypothetical protein
MMIIIVLLGIRLDSALLIVVMPKYEMKLMAVSVAMATIPVKQLMKASHPHRK